MNAIQLMKPTLLALLLLVSLVPQSVMAVQIEVSLSRTPVNMDESFQIIFTANSTPDGAPDFSPLEQDFSILNQSQSSSTIVVNNKLSQSIQWTMNVMAKKPGTITIPAIKFGDDISAATVITITKDNSHKDTNRDNELFLDVKATPETTYVQSQIIYTMRLYRRVEITQAKLNEPELNDAIVEKLGDDNIFNTLHNGINYQVTERKYAIFPQKSGQFVINPLELTVDVIANNTPSFSDYFNPQATQTKRIVSKKIILNIKPAPAEFTGKHWLAAEQLELKQEWSGNTQQAKVGEPLTRTLQLQAKSTTVGQLPELNTTKSTDQLKVYPDQPVLQEQKKTEGLIAFREEKVALIPSAAGTYTLPAVQIPWFNTQSQKMEIARLPETTLTAVASANNPSPISAPPATVAKAVQSNTIKEKVKPTSKVPQVQYNKWLWVTCIFLLVGWLITLIYFFSRRPSKKNVATPTHNDGNFDIKECVKRLKKACNSNDVPEAKAILLEWGQKQFDATSLGATALFCEARLRDEILILNQILYGKEAEAQWNGKKLFQYFIENKAMKAVASKDNSLEPLYRL